MVFLSIPNHKMLSLDRCIGILLILLVVDAKLELKCVSDYFKSMNSVDERFRQDNQDLYNTLKATNQKTVGNDVILDFNFGAVTASQTLNHLMQLNVSITYDLYETKNCRYKKQTKSNKENKVYINAINVSSWSNHHSWLQVLQIYPSSKVIIHDVTDEEWFANRLLPTCNDKTSKTLPVLCYIPMLQYDGNYRRELQLNQLNFDKVKLAVAAFRSLVNCVVPTKQLFTYNLNKISSVDYWMQLTKFLDISLSTNLIDHVVEGGLYAPMRKRDLLCSSDTDNYYSEISPSICDDSTQFIPLDIANRMKKCAVEYSDTMSKIFGSQYRSLLLDHMIYSSSNVLRRATVDSTRLILNPAPGTTGTTSLFTAMMQLNFTGRHYRMFSINCGSTSSVPGSIDAEMRVLSAVPSGGIFWGDTPVSERWWHLLKMYPTTKLIVTDVGDDSHWLKKRRSEHCGKMTETNWDCTTPIPVNVGKPRTELSNSFFKAIHVARIKTVENEKSYNAYRELLKCVVPSNQILWINFKEQTNSTIFWNKLITFLEIEINDEIKRALITAGVPRTSIHTGCKIGDHTCSYSNSIKNISAIIPSVCALK